MTQLDQLLQVLQEEFSLAAPEIDAALMQWLSEPGSGPRQAETAGTLFGRLAQASRLVGLEGAAIVFDLLRDTAQLGAELEGDESSIVLGWLAGWQPPMGGYLDRPAEDGAVKDLALYLGASPAALTGEQLDQLLELLRQPPVLPPELQTTTAPATSLVPLSDEDISLDVPDDVDPALFDAFLNDAPGQLETLGNAVRALAEGRAELAALQEARRAAHTFKGSGNIVGIRGIGRLAHRIEDVLDHAVARRGEIPLALARDLEQAVACLDQMVYALRGEEVAPEDGLAWLERLGDWVRAIEQGTVDTLTLQTLPAALGAPETPAERPATPEPRPASDRATAPANAAMPTLRIGVDRLDRLVRRANQGLVHHGRLEEHMRRIEERLGQLESSNRQLRDRLRDLEIAIDRQGVTLQAQAQTQGSRFDPLEMDRYSELQSLSRFASETVADEIEHARAARTEAQLAAQALRKQGQELVEQHRELLGARLVSVRQVVARLRRNVTQTAAATAKDVRLEIEGEHVQIDTDVLDRLTEPLLHLLRNAVDHGIEPPEERAAFGKPRTGVVQLRFTRESQLIRVECRDDGRGLDLSAIHERAVELGLLERSTEIGAAELARLILLPGFSTKPEVTEISGRGVGMDVVADRLRGMKGRIDIATEALAGTTFTLQVPATTGLQHALLVQVEEQLYALPSDAVVLALAAGQGTVAVTPGGTVFRYAGRELPYQKLAAWLGLPSGDTGGSVRPVVIARGAHGEVALEVDRIVDSRDLILQDIGRLLRRVRGVAGGAFRPDGRLLLLLDIEALEHASSSPMRREASAQLRRRMKIERKHALVVDDAISVRQTLSQLLQDAGYEVSTARDGFDALDALIRRKADVVLTDLEMPNLNGLELTRRLRESRLWKDMPVVMITSRATNKHLKSAEEAGVDVFLTKPYADDELLAEVRRLVSA
ncbi:response regulator [Schlegelella sp. S2-27]|uniref:histidine kinase n=1 Tax=Caldimonas mangrovi TaxID=2944811 RepID=A0ABT0YWT1_9BURK|nr:response regulator [Caldimonas mangrovi]MCM5682308.1 response regulator [Caldimonas mangrovi]